MLPMNLATDTGSGLTAVDPLVETDPMLDPADALEQCLMDCCQSTESKDCPTDSQSSASTTQDTSETC